MRICGLDGMAVAAGTVMFAFAFGTGIAQSLAASQCGKATWYDLHGRTANGENISPDEMVAAHRTLPFGTKVRVDNLGNGRTVVVRINDRGPFQSDRIIDLSRGAAEQLGLMRAGIGDVRLTTIGADGPPLDRPCRDEGLALSVPLPLPRARPPQAAHEMVPERAGDGIAARFAFAFQAEDAIQSEAADGREALAVPIDPNGRLNAKTTGR